MPAMPCTRTLTVVAFVGTLLQPTLLLAQQPEPFTPLFNGQDTWDTTQVNASHVRFAGNTLRLEGDSGWLLTTGTYQDFLLRFNARVVEKGTRGGVLFHAAVGPSRKQATCYELRLADTDGRAGTVWRNRGASSFPFKFPGPTLEVSEDWRRFELEVTGNTVRLTVDGEQLFHVTGLVLNRGRVGFVVTTGLIEFSDIRMAPVPQKSEALSFPGVLRPGDGVTLPIPLKQVKPEYTVEGLQIGAEGEVWLECVVLTDGTVGEVSIVRPLYPSLDKAAVASAKQWRFKPGTRNGEPVPVAVMISMTFTLK